MKKIEGKSFTITIDFGALLLSAVEILGFLIDLYFSIMNFSRDNIALGIVWLVFSGFWAYEVYADWKHFEPLTFKK